MTYMLLILTVFVLVQGYLLVLNGRKIKKLKEIEVHLEEELRFQQNLIDSIPIPIYYKDKDSKYMTCNKEFEKYIAKTREEIVGKNIYELIPEGDLETAYVREKELLENGGIQIYEQNGFAFDGTSREAIFYKSVLHDTDEKVRGIIGTIIDITERKNMENKLQKNLNQQEFLSEISFFLNSTENFEDKINKTLDMIKGHVDVTRIYILEKTGSEEKYKITYEWKNSLIAEVDDIPPDDKVTSAWIEIIEKEEVICMDDTCALPGELGRKLKRQNINAMIIFPLMKRDKRFGFIRIEDMMRTGRWEKSDIEFLKTVSNIISIAFEKNEQEKQIIKSMHEAENANEAKSRFIANMSHEIRTPLGGIIGIAEILRLSNLTVDQRKNVNIILESSESLLRIVNDILDFSKLESYSLKLEKTRFEIRSMVKKVVNMFSTQYTQKNVELVYYISPDVPEIVEGDPLRVEQILINILSNAVKFTEDGMIDLQIERMEEKSANGNVKIKFSVQDTGIGIPEDRIDTLFDYFTQVDESHTRKYGGTGLGLAISKRLIELMAGNLSLRTKLGAGSTFYFIVEFGVIEEFKIKHVEKDIEVFIIEGNTRVKDYLIEILGDWHVDFFSIESEEELKIITDYKEKAKDFIVLLDIDYYQEIFRGEALNLIFGDGEILKRTVLIGKNKRLNFKRLYHFHKTNFRYKELLYKPVNPDRLHEIIQEQANGAENTENAAEYSDINKIENISVLLIEDSTVNIAVITQYLKEINIHVSVVSHGTRALEKLKVSRYDLILMDIQLPEINGIELAKIIRERETHQKMYTPIIAITAYMSTEHKEKCIAAGMDDYLQKPFRLTELYEALKKNLKNGVEIKKIENIDSLDNDIKYRLHEDIFNKLIETYPVTLGNIKKALQGNDYETLKRETHKLKGEVGMLNIMSPYEMLKKLEFMGDGHQLESCKEMVELIEAEFDKFIFCKDFSQVMEMKNRNDGELN